jgi:hypothetical protein
MANVHCYRGPHPIECSCSKAPEYRDAEDRHESASSDSGYHSRPLYRSHSTCDKRPAHGSSLGLFLLWPFRTVLRKRFGLSAVRALTHDLRRLAWLRNLAIASAVELKSGATIALVDDSSRCEGKLALHTHTVVGHRDGTVSGGHVVEAVVARTLDVLSL